MPHSRDDIIHHVDNWEDLLKRPDPLAEMPTFATMENPIELFVPVKVLQKLLEDTIYSIKHNRKKLGTTPERNALYDALLVQRADALVWLKTQTRDHVFVAFHPAAESRIAEGDDSEEDGPEVWQG